MNNGFKKLSPKELKNALRGNGGGWIGKFFGDGEHAKINFTSITILVLVGSGALYTFNRSINDSIEYWKIIAPFITLCFGYLWVKGEKK